MTSFRMSAVSRVLLSSAAATILCVASACSGGSDGAGDGTFGGNAPPSGAGTPSQGSGGNGGSLGGAGGSGGGSGGSGGGTASCATDTVTPKSIPVNLVFMYDRSDSMNGDQKWTSSTKGLEGFFADPSSRGLSASLSYFCGGSCGADFSKPAVAMMSLPDSTTFAKSISAQSLCSGTPTGGAMTGALAYAESLKKATPDSVVAIVLVTDGQPTCGGGTAESAAKTGAAEGIKTYVIGFGQGSSLTNLDAWAVAGGTGKPTFVDPSNPAKFSTDFSSTLQSIRKASMSCEFQIPAASAGTLDVDKVNVTLTASGAPAGLNYDAACAGAGWRYDNVNAPTKVELCPASCNVMKNDPYSEVKLVFGCKTQGGTPK
jgi:hypothetical protein